MLNMAIIVYLENQNILLQRGVRAEMGHMGAWIELKNERIPQNKSKNRTMRPESSATYKRGLQGLQTAGLYLNHTNLAQLNRKPDMFSLQASQARLNQASRSGTRKQWKGSSPTKSKTPVISKSKGLNLHPI